MADDPNRITRLLWHLVHDRLAEAKIWMEQSINLWHLVELESAKEIIEEYERGEFF